MKVYKLGSIDIYAHTYIICMYVFACVQEREILVLIVFLSSTTQQVTLWLRYMNKCKTMILYIHTNNRNHEGKVTEVRKRWIQ